MSKEKVILVLIGRALSGKDTVGKYLIENYGFRQVVTGQLVRDYISEQNLGDPTRDLMIKVGNALRQEFGADVLVQRALQTDTNRLIIDGLRAVAEVESARRAGGVVIVIDAPIERRYEWSRGRGRISDNLTFEEFLAQERHEGLSKSTSATSLDDVVKMADYTVQNDQDLPSLYAKVDSLMANLGINK